jgi:hypothetical protein
MKKTWFAAAVGCVLAMGCEASPAPAPALNVPEGLSIEDAEPGFHTRMAYRAGDRVVHIETRRAERTPAEYLAADPSLPEFGVDVRITDADGALIYARIAGDGTDFADDSVAPPADRLLRERDIVVARAGLEAVGTSSALAAYGDEVRTLGEVARAFDPHTIYATPAVAVDDIVASELSGGVAAVAAAANQWKNRIALWKVHCCVPGGWHSATRTDNYSKNGAYWSAQVDYCNHGRCPEGDGMAQNCSWTSGYRNDLARAQKCSTGQGESPYSHNCNDDSHLEVIDVRHNKYYSTNDGSCHDFGANPTPDGCDPSTW